LYAQNAAMKKKEDANQENVLNVANPTVLTKNNNLKIFLENIYLKFSADEYLGTDPIIYPKTYKGDTEYIAFISSLFAYGRVPLIQKFLNEFFEQYGSIPVKKNIIKKKLYYRFQTGNDIYILVKFLANIYKDYGSIENCFFSLSENLEEGLKHFINKAHNFGINNNAGSGYFFLFPVYGKSALKRMRMFLRWMVRDTDIDFGLWKKFDKSELLFPLDTHIIRFSRNLKLISSSSGTHKNAVSVTNFFKNIEPADPLKYDFPITRLGITGGCNYSSSLKCNKCNEADFCPFI
jgi:uncharacterized protein (TIGR02757 family)